MRSSSPSDTFCLLGPSGVVPIFDSDYNVEDPASDKKYYDELAAFRKAWYRGRALAIGDSFDVTLPATIKPEGGRELPPFAHNGGDHKVIVTEVLQPFIESETRWSIICTADVRTRDESNEIRGNVIMKILQGSLLPYETRSPPALAITPSQLAGCENYAYNQLKDLQGTVIPYYYGKHKLTMKNGEFARVLILEHIQGVTVEEWMESFPEHDDVDDPKKNSPFYDTMLAQAKSVIILSLHGITEINKRGILHRDICVENLLITPSADNIMHVVFVDFARCFINMTEAKFKKLRYDEQKTVMKLLVSCCGDHRVDLVEWAEAEGLFFRR